MCSIKKTLLVGLSLIISTSAHSQEYTRDVPIFISSGPFSYVSAIMLDEYPDGYYLSVSSSATDFGNVSITAGTPSSEFSCTGIIPSIQGGNTNTPELVGIRNNQRILEKMAARRILNLKKGSVLFIAVIGNDPECRFLQISQDSRNNQLVF